MLEEKRNQLTNMIADEALSSPAAGSFVPSLSDPSAASFAPKLLGGAKVEIGGTKYTVLAPTSMLGNTSPRSSVDIGGTKYTLLAPSSMLG